VGDTYEKAESAFNKQGFKKIDRDRYQKDNVGIMLSGDGQITRIRVYVEDPAYKDIVF